VGRRLYAAIFAEYTRKQWGQPALDLAASVTARIPVRPNREDRYFMDKHQASHGRRGHFISPVCFIRDSPYKTNRGA
jgi:UDP-galactopyranose mutase